MANRWSQLSKNTKNLIVATIVFTLMALARYYGSRNAATPNSPKKNQATNQRQPG